MSAEPTDNDRRSGGRQDDRPLSERLAEAGAAEGLPGFRKEVASLAVEVHKLRGTLSAYAPRNEVQQEIGKRIHTMEKEITKSRRTRLRQISLLGLALLALITFLQVRTYQRLDTSVRAAVLSNCEQRQQLEGVLRQILLDTAAVPTHENPEREARRQTLLREAAQRPESPPCDSLFDNAHVENEG